MDKSESIIKLAKALSEAQGEIKNPANTANNPFFKSKYAPLADVLNLARPILSGKGLSVIQAPGGDGEHITVSTILLHESGEWLEVEPITLKAEKITPQGAGSAITYGRRYALSAVLGIASEDDDDGNAHEAKKEIRTPQKKAPAPEPQNTADTAPDNAGAEIPDNEGDDSGAGEKADTGAYSPNEKNASSIANLKKILKLKTGEDNLYDQIIKIHGKEGDITVMRELAKAVNTFNDCEPVKEGKK